MKTDTSRRAVTMRALTVGLLTAVLALVGLVGRAGTLELTPSPGEFYAPAFRSETSGVGAVLNAHDGQAFGSLALDPLLSRPSDWGGGNAEMAYRASRPLLGWLVMATSFGSATAAGWSLIGWTAIGIGVMAAGAVVLANQWRRRSDWVPLLLVVPGVAGQLLFGGLSDGLATGLALLGLAWWLEHRDSWAIVALCLAALARETTLLVPLALLLASGRGRAPRLLIPFAVYAGWVGVVWARLGALPTDARAGRLGLPPGNFGAVMGSWSVVEVVCAGTILAAAAVAWWRAPCREVRWLVVVSMLFAATLGPAVLRSWDFTRPLLPVTVVGACLLARRLTDATAGETQPVLAGPAVPPTADDRGPDRASGSLTGSSST